MPGDVRGGSRSAPPTRHQSAGAEMPVLVGVKRHARVLEPQELVRRLPAHDLDRVLVTRVVRPLTVLNVCDSQLSSGFSAALILPRAATEWERTGWTFETIETDAPACAAASAARWSASPALMIRAS